MIDIRHIENHKNHRNGWLRAAVLGASDGIVSTSSLVIGVTAAAVSPRGIVLAGVAGLVAGAMSMAASEYVSASSQADTEKADLDRERQELANEPEQEQMELAAIYVARGLDASLAEQVASQLMARDALGTHARDELGISEHSRARPIKTGLASAATFAMGAMLPLLVVFLWPVSALLWPVAISTLIFLALLGSIAAWAGGAPVMIAAVRTTFWGALAMSITAAVGKFFGALV